MRKAYFTPEELLSKIKPFVSNRTGLIGPAAHLPVSGGNPAISVYGAVVSDANRLSEAYLHGSDDGLFLSGAGSSLYRDQAEIKAYCEALERYCTVVFNPDAITVATRQELGDSAIDLEKLPRGRKEEYRHPYTFLVPPNNSAEMRWVQGYSLISGEPKWVPMGMVYISSAHYYRGEAFYPPITTGSALAASYEQAIISGTQEVIERDALTLTWLHKLPLPQIDVSDFNDPDFTERMRRLEEAGVKQYFFNATTDLGVSTVYALQVNPHSNVAVVVMAATRLDPREAIVKVIDETASSRYALEKLVQEPRRYNPENFHSFTRLTDGAVYYCDAQNLSDFDFLIKNKRTCTIADMPNLKTADVEADLRRLVDLFQAQQLELVVVDITVPEIRQMGFYVVKVIVPQLLPLTTNYNLRYLASQRLYEAPSRMGYGAKTYDQINPLPQPFA